ncbi:MAG: amidase family protein, partial [Woeseiaceae bacterium]
MSRIGLIVLAVLISGCAKEPVTRPVPDYPSVGELVAMLENGETSSVAIVTELLARAEAKNHLNAYIMIDADGALARAAELDAMRADGNLLGAMHGVPFVVKDNTHVAGLPNSAGTPGLADFVPAADAPTVAALRQAGGIILGKTNLHELAFGITSDNAAYGAVGNPFDPTTFAGGSSGGTASAVSAGLAPVGLGTDTGGSVRIPPALTGTVGFRPSTDRYDSSGVTPISHTRDTVGIIARNVADVDLLDQVMKPGEMLAAISA